VIIGALKSLIYIEIFQFVSDFQCDKGRSLSDFATKLFVTGTYGIGKRKSGL